VKRFVLKLKLILVLVVVILLTLALSNNLIVGNSSNIVSFAIVHFLSYLFFLLMPAEIFFLYYLSEGQNQLLLLFIALTTAISAQICDYAIGFLAANNIQELIKPKRYHKYKNIVNKYGYPIIFIFNLTPLSSPIVVLISGFMKLSLRRVLVYSFAGLFIKYLVIIIVFNLFV
jgi:membrane protein YqaA with SNARE-associated domain